MNERDDGLFVETRVGGSGRRRVARGNDVKPALEAWLVYDNHQARSGSVARADWGFACLVKTAKKTVLFDTGTDSRILLGNMRAMNFDPATVDAVVLSHLDSDHVGGLPGLVRANPHVHLYLPPCFVDRFAGKWAGHEGEVTQVRGEVAIAHGLWVTADDETLALLTDLDGGLLMLASRIPGKVLKMLSKIRASHARRIDLLIAGFCFFSPEKPENLVSAFKALGVSRIAPCHCCPMPVREVFAQYYGRDYVSFMLGNGICFGGNAKLLRPL
jgi:7,8-dihydropterin-6-yl-methyl-4-(beta-D-ribofuranosyl)aminobenzene 5'-phosphate synthase